MHFLPAIQICCFSFAVASKTASEVSEEEGFGAYCEPCRTSRDRIPEGWGMLFPTTCGRYGARARKCLGEFVRRPKPHVSVHLVADIRAREVLECPGWCKYLERGCKVSEDVYGKRERVATKMCS